MKGIVKFAFVPFYPVLGESGKNLETITQLAKEIYTKEKPGIIIFPELATSGYLLENLAQSASIEAPAGLPGELLELSRSMEIHLGALVREGGTLYNAAIVLSGAQVVHLHRKIYLPTYGLFDEKRYYVAGDQLEIFHGVLGKTATLVCEDAFHPALAYALFARGADHVVVLSSSPARGVEEEGTSAANAPASYLSWRKRLEVYAESFGQCYYYINRSGSEDGVYFDGRAMIAPPNRRSFEYGGSGDAPYHIVEVDTRDIISAHARGGPFVNENWNLNLKCIEEAHQARKSGTSRG